MKKLIFLFCLLPSLIFAQNSTVKRPDKVIEPNPYEAVYFADANDYSNIKSIAIIRKQKSKGFRVDTSQIEYFEDGLKMKTVSYRNNLPIYRTIMTYNDDKTLNNWEIFYPKYSTKNIYQHDAQRRIINTQKVNIKRKKGKIDSTQTTQIAFKYDDKLGLIAIERKSNFGVGTETYHYDKNKQLTQVTGGSIFKMFNYDEHKNLLTIREYMGKFATEMLMNSKRFEFDEHQNLVADYIVTSGNREKGVFQETHYTYDDKHQLETMKVTFGDLYRNLDFKFVDNKIQTIIVQTNGHSAYLKTWMPYGMKDNYSFPITYKEVFEYDDYGNKIAKRIYVGEELFSETEFLIEYRK